MTRESTESGSQHHKSGQRIRTSETGVFMSAALSYPGPVLKSSAKSRSQILILEPDLAVLDYLRLTLADRYSLKPVFRRTDSAGSVGAERCSRSIVAGAAHEPGPSAVVDTYSLLEAEPSGDRALVLG